MKNSPASCPVCGDGNASRLTTTLDTEHMGQRGVVSQFLHRCDTCRSEYADAEDMRDNRRAIVRFRKAVEGIPLGCEIREMRLRAHLKQEELARLVGGGAVAFSKYEADDLIPTGAMVTLLKLLIAFPDVIGKVRTLHGKQVRISMYAYMSEAESHEWESAGESSSPGRTAAHITASGIAVYSKEPAWEM